MSQRTVVLFNKIGQWKQFFTVRFEIARKRNVNPESSQNF